MAKDFSTMEDSNRSANPSIHDLSDPARRTWAARRPGGAGVGGVLAPLAGAAARRRPAAAAAARLQGHPRRPPPTRVVVPEGYVAEVHRRLGRAGRRAPARCRPGASDAGNSAAEQALQMGMHHDGIHFYPARRQQHARPAGDEPRVHRRRPAAPRRHEDLERREGAQGAGRARRVGDRGRAEGRPLADGAAVALRAPLHRQHAVRGAAARPPATR